MEQGDGIVDRRIDADEVPHELGQGALGRVGDAHWDAPDDPHVIVEIISRVTCSVPPRLAGA
jgi:hypothetical protein